VVDGLWERVAKEWSLAMEMKRNVDDLNEKMQAIENLGQEVTGLNIKMIESFGGVIEGIPAEACASDIFSWMSDNFATLSDFVLKVGDFAALCGVRNLLCMEESLGCNHLEEFGRKSYKFSSPGELGEPSKLVKLVSGRYMSEFWARFGQDHACTLVEARWAEVSPLLFYPLCLRIVSYIGLKALALRTFIRHRRLKSFFRRKMLLGVLKRLRVQ
jgi:hypothetical protein